LVYIYTNSKLVY
jgi:hypothetical protein